MIKAMQWVLEVADDAKRMEQRLRMANLAALTAPPAPQGKTFSNYLDAAVYAQANRGRVRLQSRIDGVDVFVVVPL